MASGLGARQGRNALRPGLRRPLGPACPDHPGRQRQSRRAARRAPRRSCARRARRDHLGADEATEDGAWQGHTQHRGPQGEDRPPPRHRQPGRGLSCPAPAESQAVRGHGSRPAFPGLPAHASAREPLRSRGLRDRASPAQPADGWTRSDQSGAIRGGKRGGPRAESQRGWAGTKGGGGGVGSALALAAATWSPPSHSPALRRGSRWVKWDAPDFATALAVDAPPVAPPPAAWYLETQVCPGREPCPPATTPWPRCWP